MRAPVAAQGRRAALTDNGRWSYEKQLEEINDKLNSIECKLDKIKSKNLIFNNPGLQERKTRKTALRGNSLEP